jgi:hypothetical protein
MQVAFMKLRIPVTDRQLRRVAEALISDIHTASRTQAKDVGVSAYETLRQVR